MLTGPVNAAVTAAALRASGAITMACVARSNAGIVTVMAVAGTASTSGK